MKDNNEMKELFRILRFLTRQSANCYRNNQNVLGGELDKKAEETYKFLIKTRYPLPINELDDEKIDHKSHSFERNNIYLPPFYRWDKEFIPIMNFKINYSRGSKPDLCMKIALITVNGEGGKLRVFGYRYESPSEPDDGGESEHNYFHQQFTREPFAPDEKQKDLCETTAEWAPEHIPCTITPARTAVQHLICMIIGLYGAHAKEIITKMSPISGESMKPLQYVP